MKRIEQLVWFCVMCVFWLQTTAHPVFAAPPPEYVKQMIEEAPLQVVGLVEADTKLYNDSFSEGAEGRKATLRVQEVKKKPSNLTLAAGDTVDFFYTYIPPDIPIAGPARVDIIEGDQIEIWLKQGEEGWIPAISGNAIHLLQAAGPRPGTPPEREVSKWLSSNYEFVILGACALVLLWIIRRNAPRSANV